MLTAAQHRTLAYIRQYMGTHGFAPTAAEIAKGIGIRSRGVVHRYVQAIADEGLITRVPGRRRNIRLVPKVIDTHQVPVIGKIAAGTPIEAILDHDSVDIVESLLGPNRYALRVKGDSMIYEGIFDNDVVICERSDTAHDGQIVVALIDEREATLKRFKRGNNKTVTLFPANAAHAPQVYEASRVKIQGLFIGLLRLA